jgi:hypothetical protein
MASVMVARLSLTFATGASGHGSQDLTTAVIEDLGPDQQADKMPYYNQLHIKHNDIMLSVLWLKELCTPEMLV